MTASISYAEACQDPHLFGPWFAGDSWSAWRVLDKALFGQPLDVKELQTFTALTSRPEAPEKPAREAWIIAGRRSGKDVKAASVAAYLATIGAAETGIHKRLTPGERGVVQLLAVDRDQAAVCFGYLKAMFEQPMLAALVTHVSSDSIELNNRLAIEVTTNDKRRVRGRTVIAAVFDEVAFWRSDQSANPDDEVYRAIRPAMATIPNAILIGISSPYARRGLLYTKWKKHFGKPGDVLVVQAPTWVMNPTLPRDGEFIAQAYTDDPAAAAAEFGAEFRTDVEQFVSLEVVEACVSQGVTERPPIDGVLYRAFVDPSGGSNDAFTLAISHKEGEAVILDAVRERRPPFSPQSVVEEFSELLKSYRVSEVTGDRYGGEFPRELFRKQNISYRVAEKNRSELYRDALLPRLNAGTVELPDLPKLVSQIVGLERRVSRGGKESIDHPPGGHDDLANAVAGSVSLHLKKVTPCVAAFGTWSRAASETPRNTVFDRPMNQGELPAAFFGAAKRTTKGFQ